MRSPRTWTMTLMALLLGACALSVGPLPVSQAPSPTPTPAWTTFTSDRFAYSIDIPAGWEVLERVGEVSLPGARPRYPGTDTISTPQGHREDSRDETVVIAAREMADGESLEDWTELASSATPCPSFGHDTRTLGGEQADLRKFECGGVFWTQLTAVHGGRGYMVWLVSTSPRPEGRPINDHFLQSFAFAD